MNSEGRRGGRPIKPATPGKKVKLGLLVPAEVKDDLDAGKNSGRTQGEEAVRLMQLGRLFEQFGRFTLPPEQQKQAVELLAAFSDGSWALVRYFIEHGQPKEKERWLRWQSILTAVESYPYNNPIRWRPEDEAKAEPQQQSPVAGDDKAS
jgi:hypothetical protein